uniref:Uncharacterized protein n=1 Tax=Nothobranchius kadleci TaxID=1051664 RepID=A0A1A8BWM5_NOTKA
MTQSTLNQKDRVLLISRSEGFGLFWKFFMFFFTLGLKSVWRCSSTISPFTPYTSKHVRNKKSFNFITTGIPSGSQTHRSFLQKQEHLVRGWPDSVSSSSAALLVLLNTK